MLPRGGIANIYGIINSNINIFPVFDLASK